MRPSVTAVPALPTDESDPSLDAFASESAKRPEVLADRPRAPERRYVWWAAALAAVLGLAAVWLLVRTPASSSATLVVSVEGASVRVDGNVVGRAPIKLSVAPGEHLIEVVHGESTPSLSGTVQPAASLGAIAVTSDTGSGRVFVEGVDRGTTPVTLNAVPAGQHSVRVVFPTGTVARTLEVSPGATTSLVVSPPVAAGALSGWLQIASAEPLQIFEDGRLLGTSRLDRMMLPAGSHTLELVNEELGFRTRRSVSVNPGATTRVGIDLPQGTLAVNAQPWAEVWIDGEPAGSTPIGGRLVTIGRHDLLFRHPQFGERRASVVVKFQQAARIGIDLRSAP